MQAKSLHKNIRRALRAGLPAFVLAAAFGAHSAAAQSLQDALAKAYMSNPTLEAQRAALRATDELIPQARSGFLPSITATGDYSRSRSEVGNQVAVVSPRSVDVTLTQSVFSGGTTVANVSRAENLVRAQRAQLLSTEQNVLLSAATSYSDVVRDEAVLKLNINNEQVLRRQLEASQDRFRVGEITRTDVSQAESRLARATADRILSEGVLNATRAEFARLVGASPESLNAPALTMDLPDSLGETITLAEEQNPGVLGAKYASAAAGDAVDATVGQLLPSVGLIGTVGRDWDRIRDGVVEESASIVARVTVPIYQGSAATAQVREAKHTANQRRIEIEAQMRAARETAIRAWEALVTARASIQSRESQVKSADIALEGVRQEATVGSRTVLDVLDAEQELLEARVQLVRAQRDEIVAAFQVLSATGQLTAAHLALPVDAYDPDRHYNDARGKLWGVSVD